MPAAARFFQELLEFELRTTMGDPVWFAIVGRDDAEVTLVRAERPAVPGIVSVYVNVVGVGEVHERWVAKGGSVANGLELHPWGTRDFVVRGPDGHLIAVGERVR